MEELNHYLDLSNHYLKSINPSELIARITSEESRNALYSPSFNHLRSFGLSLKTIIDSASSDEGSDEASSYPTVLKVSQRILDISSLILSDNALSQDHSPCVFLAPILNSRKYYQIAKILKKVISPPTDIQICDFNLQYPKAALISFNSFNIAKEAFFKLKELDLFDMCGENKMVKLADYALLHPKFDFFAVVLRGFNKNISVTEINKMLPMHSKRCELRIINGITCGVAVMKSLLDVCIVCKKLNNTRNYDNKILKAHVHPITEKKYSKKLIETLMSDLPNLIQQNNEKNDIDVLKVLDLGMKRAANSYINPLNYLIKKKK